VSPLQADFCLVEIIPFSRQSYLVCQGKQIVENLSEFAQKATEEVKWNSVTIAS
jgi:hypothetical protein